MGTPRTPERPGDTRGSDANASVRRIGGFFKSGYRAGAAEFLHPRTAIRSLNAELSRMAILHHPDRNIKQVQIRHVPGEPDFSTYELPPGFDILRVKITRPANILETLTAWLRLSPRLPSGETVDEILPTDRLKINGRGELESIRPYSTHEGLNTFVSNKLGLPALVHGNPAAPRSPIIFFGLGTPPDFADSTNYLVDTLIQGRCSPDQLHTPADVPRPDAALWKVRRVISLIQSQGTVTT